MAEYGSYGIKSVPSDTPNALTCGRCGRSWLEDITPGGRCPWEDVHEDSQEESTLSDVLAGLEEYRIHAAREEVSARKRPLVEGATPTEMYWRGARIAYENAIEEVKLLGGTNDQG